MPALAPRPVLPALLAAALLSACAHELQPVASAFLDPSSGSQVRGSVTFTPAGDKTRIEAIVRGLPPGQHGIHIHETGDCSAPDASSAGGHFNPTAQPHGDYAHTPHHTGDLPNLTADAQGDANYVAEVGAMSLGQGRDGVVGRSVVIHADPDDYKTQPAGNSGKRIACGVIKAL